MAFSLERTVRSAAIGALLARERWHSGVSYEVLLERFSSIRLLTDRPAFHNAIVLRGLRSLPVGATRKGRAA